MTYVEIWDPKRQLTLQISTDRLEALYWACRMAMECDDIPADLYVVLAEAVSTGRVQDVKFHSSKLIS